MAELRTTCEECGAKLELWEQKEEDGIKTATYFCNNTKADCSNWRKEYKFIKGKDGIWIK